MSSLLSTRRIADWVNVLLLPSGWDSESDLERESSSKKITERVRGIRTPQYLCEHHNQLLWRESIKVFVWRTSCGFTNWQCIECGTHSLNLTLLTFTHPVYSEELLFFLVHNELSISLLISSPVRFIVMRGKDGIISPRVWSSRNNTELISTFPPIIFRYASKKTALEHQKAQNRKRSYTDYGTHGLW